MSVIGLAGLDGGYVEVTPQQLGGLESQATGRLIRDGEDGWDQAVLLWNGMIAKAPALVLQPGDARDVATAVRFARDHGLLVSIKSGGHNIAGTSIADGGLTLDMSRMRAVTVDEAARLAHVEPGCLLGDVDQATQQHGLATVLVVCYSGDPADAGKAVAPIRALRDPVLDLLHQQPYLQLQSFLDDTEPTGSHYYWRTEYMAELSDGLLSAVRDLFSTCPIPGGEIGFLHLAGALNERAEDDGAVGNRNARFVIGGALVDHAAGQDPITCQWHLVPHRAGAIRGRIPRRSLPDDDRDLHPGEVRRVSLSLAHCLPRRNLIAAQSVWPSGCAAGHTVPYADSPDFSTADGRLHRSGDHGLGVPRPDSGQSLHSAVTERFERHQARSRADDGEPVVRPLPRLAARG